MISGVLSYAGDIALQYSCLCCINSNLEVLVCSKFVDYSDLTEKLILVKHDVPQGQKCKQ